MKSVIERFSEKFAVPAHEAGVAFGIMGELKVKAAERDQPTMISAIATTSRVDLDSEVVVSSGLNTATFSRLKAVYYNHDYSGLPIGAMRRVVPVKGSEGWRVFLAMARHQFAQDVATAVEDGAIRGTSIGFRRIDWGEPNGDELARYGPHEVITRSADWIELSITPMPCNQDALIEGLELPDDSAKALERLAVKGRIKRESAYAMGLPKPKVMLRVPRVLQIGGV